MKYFLITSLLCFDLFAQTDIVIPDIPTAQKINEMITPAVLPCEIQSSTPSSPIDEKILSKCYSDHPIFMEVLMLTSDTDFANGEKSKIRIEKFKLALQENADSIRNCTAILKQYAAEQKDPKNEVYVNFRLSEIIDLLQK